jgi:glycosyltransferase involved in cell wall biosynthesis
MRQLVSLVLVVDDGSTDATARLAESAGATVIRHERNCGKGAALRSGLSQLVEQGFVWAVTLDGDGQHAPQDLHAMLRCAKQTGALLVIGNRMDNARAMPWLRRLVNRWMSRRLSQHAGRHLPDSQSGFRLIHLGTWAALPLETERFEIESETLMAFLTAGHRVEFVPIRVVRGSRRSHIHPVADSIRWLRWWRSYGRLSTSRRPLGPAVQASLPTVTQTEMLR